MVVTREYFQLIEIPCHVSTPNRNMLKICWNTGILYCVDSEAQASLTWQLSQRNTLSNGKICFFNKHNRACKILESQRFLWCEQFSHVAVAPSHCLLVLVNYLVRIGLKRFGCPVVKPNGRDETTSSFCSALHKFQPAQQALGNIWAQEKTRALARAFFLAPIYFLAPVSLARARSFLRPFTSQRLSPSRAPVLSCAHLLPSACLPRARPFFLAPIYFLAPVSLARARSFLRPFTSQRLSPSRAPVLSCTHLLPSACLPRARPFFLAPIYFLAPATQAT